MTTIPRYGSSDVDRLRSAVAKHRSMLVAYSGGVDSTLVLKVARDVLGDRAEGVLAVSPSLPASERGDAEAIARLLDVPLRIVETRELEDPRYSANPRNRCYFCKSELFSLLEAEARGAGFETLAYGANVDDEGDVRPGMAAARDFGVVAPLIEAGLGKTAIRAIARDLGLPNWDKPAKACLSSRIPHGIEVTEDKLAAIETAEEGLARLGFHQVRVRWHGEIARIELGPDEIARMADPNVRERMVRAVRSAGFRFITVDLEGYRQGSLNDPPLLQIVPRSK